jgi:hypothetical protein
MKNEHLVWAYSDTTDGKGKVVVLGLTDEGPDERAKGFVRPYRDSYKHVGAEQELVLDDSRPSHRVRTGGCGTVTTMGRALSETYARDPKFYGATFCCGCNRHLPVSEFVWTVDGQQVGS